MQNTGVSPVIVNCVFSDNGLVEGLDGGAIYNALGANAYISSSSFINNYRSAIYNDESSPTIHNCDFLNNLSDYGGAIKNRGETAQPLISSSFFAGNAASIDGGAISNILSDPLIESCLFTGNTAGQNGGAISNYDQAQSNIINSLFSGNTAAAWGGAIYNLSSAPVIINCTFGDNLAGSPGGGIASEAGSGKGPDIRNTILWGNSGSQIYEDAPTKTDVSYSNIMGGYPGEGNVDLDPSFMDTATGDYRLRSDSPCIDAGDNLSVSAFYDLIGNSRIVDGNIDGSAIVDMGGYEFIP